MPVYEYKAYGKKGQSVSGSLDADSPRDAREKLRKQSLFVTGLSPIKQSGKTSATFRLPAFLQKRKSDEVGLLTRQMATLLGAGIPMTQALTALIEQSANEKMSRMIRDVREKVTQGASLADALAYHPAWYDDLFVNMVRAGEASGNLDAVLARLADYAQKQNRLRNKVTAALFYPIIMIVMGFVVVSALMTFVVPKLTALLTEADKALPLPTRILITLSDLAAERWWALLLGIIFAMVAFRIALQNPKFRRRYDGYVLKIPVVGDLLLKSSVSRFANTFSTLLKSGVPVLEGLAIVREIVKNRVLAETLEDVRTRILQGADLSTPLKQSGVFPPMVGYMIAVGEQSGNLEGMLDKVVEAYDEELDLATQKMTALIEPLIIVVLAGLVGFIVLSILLPILEIGDLN
jgi:general secretion pathway protein F